MSHKKSREGASKSQNDRTVHVHQREKIGFDLNIQLKFELSPKQKELVDLILNKKNKIFLIKGPAGSAKSYLSIYTALVALRDKRVGEIRYIRQPVESSSFNIGFIPGEKEEKLSPYMHVLQDKLREFISEMDIKRLEKEGAILSDSIGFMRGSSLNSSFIIGDEAQNFMLKDFLLVMTRLGKFSKMVFCGDVAQSDVKNGAFDLIYNIFNNPESKERGIQTFEFSKEDIVREPLIAFILEKFESINAKSVKIREH